MTKEEIIQIIKDSVSLRVNEKSWYDYGSISHSVEIELIVEDEVVSSETFSISNVDQ